MLLPQLQAKAELELRRRNKTLDNVWVPFSDTPQEDAYHSEADEIFYGGAAGGGKSDLLLGLAMTQQTNSIIFRREYPQLKGLIERSREILENTDASYNGMEKVWRNIPGGKRLEFGAVQYDKDKTKYQGRPHDLKGFDEVTNFTKKQYQFLTAWARTHIEEQRVRIVATGNPPSTDEGLWVIDHWGAWLDEEHPDYPEKPGVLRWYAMVDGEEIERPNGAPFKHKGERGPEVITPRSRTFFPASVDDNPYYVKTGYKSILQGLPEPLRSQLLYGDFQIEVEGDPFQVIPTKWVRDAMTRGKDRAMPKVPLTQMGADIARFGKDSIIFAKRFGDWFAPLMRLNKQDTMATAEAIRQEIWDEGIAVIDILNMGAGVYDRCMQFPNIRRRTVAFGAAEAAKNSNGEPYKDRTNKLTFVNKRAWAYWCFRDVLDPALGDNVSLPYDRELLIDLTAPKWIIRSNGIQLEAKEKIVERIGRSPDKGDAIVMSNIPVIPTSLQEQPKQKSRFATEQEGSRWKGM